MDSQTLAALEQATTPYRLKGFVITSQTEGAIILTLPPERFSYFFFFLTLLLLWPVAVVYLVSHYNQRDKNVCLRVTSQGYIEESGYTLEVLARDRRRRIIINVVLFSLVAVVVLLVLVRVYSMRT
jgi:membrane-associated PAP2 superfamily phosphatase